MERVAENLQHIAREEVERYVAISSPEMAFYPVLDDAHAVYAVLIVPGNQANRPAWAFVMARIVGDYIVIEEDGPQDKPLHQALMTNGGIPRERIILAYQGEAVPD